MQSNTKANTIVTHRVVRENVLGFTVIGYPEIEMDLTKVHEDNRAYAEYHGWAQRVPDKAAIGQADKDGRIRAVSERNRLKYDAMRRIVDHYQSGSADWTMRAAASGDRGGLDHALTIAAVAAVQGVGQEIVHEYVKRQAERMNVSRTAVLDTLAGTARFAEKIAEMRRTRTAGVDVEEMLAELPIAD